MDEYTAPPLQIRFSPIAPPRRLTIDSIFSLGHTIYKSGWGLIVGAFTIAVLIQGLVAAISGVVDVLVIGPNAIVSPFSTIANILVGTPVTIGPLYLAVRVYRGERAELSDAWIGFTRWLAIIAVGLVVQVAAIAPTVAFSVTAGYALGNTGSPALALAGIAASIVTLVVAVFVAVRLYFATLLCVDPAGPRPAITECLALSWRLTAGHTLKLLTVAILLGIIATLTLMCVLVPFFLYGGPILATCAAAAYAMACHESGLIPLAPYGDTCPHCQYDLRDTRGDRCPECGRHVPRQEIPPPRSPGPADPDPII